MKIWCLRCGHVLAETQRARQKETVCPTCGLQVRYSVNRNVGRIRAEAAGKAANQDLLIYHI